MTLFSRNMPPKSRKSLGNSWYTCEACGVLISHKDVQMHQGVCPVDIINYNHSFIKNAALFSFIEKYSITGNKHIRLYFTQFYVFLIIYVVGL